LQIVGSAASSTIQVNQTFTSASSATDWFNSHTIDFGQAGSLGMPGNPLFNLQVSLALTGSAPTDFFQVEAALLVPEPSAVCSMALGAVLLMLVQFRSRPRRKRVR